MKLRHDCPVLNCLAGCLALGVLSIFLYPEYVKSDKKEREKESYGNEVAPVGLRGVELEELESDSNPEVKRLIVPPYYQERRGSLKLQLLFPFFIKRERQGKGSERDLGIFPFYWGHRSKNEKTDVIFPLYWRFRGIGFKTDIVLQTHYNRSEHGYSIGFGPLFYFGKDIRDHSSYQIVPPLFWQFSKEDSSFLLAGIFYNRRIGKDFDMGFPPLVFAGREKYKTYSVVLPPLFFRFKNEIAYTTKTILPPLFFNTREYGWSFGLMPLFYLARNRDWDKTLVLPFYYGSRWPQLDKQGESKGEGRTYVFPALLSYYKHAPGLSRGGAAIFYHWYWKEGDYLKMYSPLLWLYGNDRIEDNALLIPPLFYRRVSPVRDDTMVSLVFWNFHEHHKERTVAMMPLFAHNWNLYEKHWRTWVLPSFDIGFQPDGYHFRLHPIFYRGKNRTSDHLIIAPLWWKFTDEEDDDLVFFPFYWRFKDLLHDDSSRIVFPFWWQFDDPRRKNFARIAFPLFWDFRRGKKESRTTLGLPIYWRHRTPYATTTGILNVFINKGEIKGNPFWSFNLEPILAFGKPPAPSGAYWSFLHGLVEWRRQGRSKRLKMMWIPIKIGP